VFCLECGFDIPDDAKFCSMCGRSLQKIPAVGISQPPLKVPVASSPRRIRFDNLYYALLLTFFGLVVTQRGNAFMQPLAVGLFSVAVALLALLLCDLTHWGVVTRRLFSFSVAAVATLVFLVATLTWQSSPNPVGATTAVNSQALCQDALARRRQAEDAMSRSSGNPSADYFARSRATSNRDDAETAITQYCGK
jgi:hypothetical protein